jgi:hypothetical protein
MNVNRRVTALVIAAAFTFGLIAAEAVGARGVTVAATGVAAVAAAVAGGAAATAARRARMQTHELATKLRALDELVATLVAAAESQKTGIDQLQTELRAMEDRDRGIVSYLADIHDRIFSVERPNL